MAKKTKEEDPAVEPVEAAEVVKRDPATTVGVDQSASGDYEYVDAPAGWAKDRKLEFQGRTFEHCAVDADGVWLFRVVRG